MSSNDPFEFLSKTLVPKETIMSLEESTTPTQNKEDPFDFLGNTSPIGFKSEAPKPTGVVGAFAEGVGGGLVRPFTFITKPLLGYEYTPDPGITSRASKAAEFLGSFAGLGISFIPFSAATGLALKGVGLAESLAESPELYQFVKGTIAGSAQFTGESKNLSEAKNNAIQGAAFGAAIEGLFLAASLRSRTGRVIWPSNRVGPPTGTEVALRPGQGLEANLGGPAKPIVRPDQLAKEIEIAPSEYKTADRMHEELTSLFNPEPIPPAEFKVQYPGPESAKAISAKAGVGKVPVVHQTHVPTVPEGIDNVLVDIAQEHVTTTRITNVGDDKNLIAYAQAKLGSSAQVISRNSLGGKEILVHNPFHESDALTPAQVAQWKSLGVYDGMEGIYKNKSYAFTGEPVAEGRVQIRDPQNSSRVFAPKAIEVSVPVSPKYYPKTSAGMALKQTVEQYKKAIAEGANKIGFVIQSNEPGSARRGVVDTSEYEEFPNLQAFAKKYKDELAAIPNAPNQIDAFNMLAQRKGIKGLIIKDDGITTDLHIFDQNTVKFVQEPPRFGLTLDNATVAADVNTGKMNLLHLQPSWKNTAAGILRDKGFPEKEINKFLDEQAQFFGKTIDDLMTPEFKTAKKVSEGQFYEGCF